MSNESIKYVFMSTKRLEELASQPRREIRRAADERPNRYEERNVDEIVNAGDATLRDFAAYDIRDTTKVYPNSSRQKKA